MFAWIRNLFAKSHVDVAIRDLEAAKNKLEAAVIKETEKLVYHNTTLETAHTKTNEVLRALEDEIKDRIAAENARFTAVKEKIESKVYEKSAAVNDGTELLNKIKSVI